MMKTWFRIALVAAWAVALAPGRADAGPQLKAGPYSVEITSDPAVIPSTGRAKLRLAVRDRAGKPVAAAQVTALAAMPGMPMGEREEAAAPAPGQPGTYVVPASFPMAGRYRITVNVAGPEGTGTGSIDVSTGQNTGGGGTGTGLLRPLFFLLLIGLLAWSVWRSWRVGYRFPAHALVRPQILGGILLLVAMVAVSAFAIANWRRKGAMTPYEAQALDMTHMPAPVGHVAVSLARVERGSVAASVRYSGSAVGFVEQDVYPRVQGWITWMPFYAGDRAKKGQLLARLDTSELDARVAEREAAARQADHQAMIAQQGYRQSLATAAQARSEIASKEGMLRDVQQQKKRAEGMLKQAQHELGEARSEVAEARESLAAADAEQQEARADVAAAETMRPDAEAQLAAARADEQYAQAQATRSTRLLEQGIVSAADQQRDRAAAQNAVARVRQAEARIRQVDEQVRAAQSKARKAEAMQRGAGARIAQMQSRFDANQAKIEQAQAEIAGATGRISQAEADVEAARSNARAMQAATSGAEHQVEHAQAGVAEARAAVASQKAVKGYTEIRSLVDGVVTQRNISPGVLVGPGQSILRVAQIRPIRLQASVPQADLARIRVGNRVRILGRESSAPEIVASVTVIFPAVDPAARTGVVEALLPNADRRILPGQFMTMEIVTDERRGTLRVPSAAVHSRTGPSQFGQSDKKQAYVWLAEAAASNGTATYYCPMHLEVRSDKKGVCPKCKMDLVPEQKGGQWKVRRADVTVGVSDGRMTEILGGLSEGSQVVVTGHQNLRDGNSVAPVNAPSGSALTGSGAHESAPAAPAASASGKYYCPMHPEVASDDPNSSCAKCGGMKLVSRSVAPHGGAAASETAAASGKYYCPMHPEVSSDDPSATCDKCNGMKLVPRGVPATAGPGK